MIIRQKYLDKIKETYDVFPICGILGPRQCGKTTLAHQYKDLLSAPAIHFDLEDPAHFDQLLNPKTTLDPLQGLIIIDEIQRCPSLFPYLRVLADYSDKRFLILGSASGELLHHSSESLAGRVDYMELPPLGLDEVGDVQRLWTWGGYPRAYLAENFEANLRWRRGYLTAFIERDLPSLGLNLNSLAMRQLMTMLAHNHGGILNYSELGRSLGVSDMTIRRYVEILSETFLVRLLRPWHENISKQQVKAPKVYIRDSGLLHALLGIGESTWPVHPKRGQSFEGFVIDEIIKHFGYEQEYYFWRTQTGLELDLMMIKGGKRYGFEIKLSDAPQVTRSMEESLKILGLEELFIVTSLGVHYKKTEKISVLGVEKIRELSRPGNPLL